jgi:hypothetical protein
MKYKLTPVSENLDYTDMYDLGWIDARCEGCGKVSRFGRTKMIKSETCPKCGCVVDFWSLHNTCVHEAVLEEQRREYWSSV